MAQFGVPEFGEPSYDSYIAQCEAARNEWPRWDHSPARIYRPMQRICSEADCRMLAANGVPPHVIRWFRRARARVMLSYCAMLNRHVKGIIQERVRTGECDSTIADDRMHLFRTITRLRALAVAYGCGMDVQRLADEHVQDALSRHLARRHVEAISAFA